MPIPRLAQSTVVWDDNTTINTINVTIAFTGNFRFYVSADNGSNWEEVTGLVTATTKQYSFTNTGTQLKWKALIETGCTITQIKIKVIG